jgi:divalent metal cation (Fe/Co/Zn/Cd) transporter
MRVFGLPYSQDDRPTAEMHKPIVGADSALVAQALRVEWLTIGWMLVETVVATGSGIKARSLTLIAFGADSVIELLSALLLLWRLKVELRLEKDFPRGLEERAAKIGAALLLVLSLYVAVSAVWAVWRGAGQKFSPPGLVIAVLAMPIMYVLAKAKLRLADALGSGALRTDAVESIACCYLAAEVVAGLVLQFFANAWWVDSVSAFALVPFLLREARESWQTESDED